MFAEQTYLFQHVVLRDAAFELQPPSARATLHGLAIEAMEAVLGGRPPIPEGGQEDVPLDANHPLHALAGELASHARLAEDASKQPDWLHAARLHYLRLAGLHADRHFRPADALRYWRELATLSEPAAAVDALRRAGEAAQLAELREDTYMLLSQTLEQALKLGDLKNASLAITLRATRYRHDGQNAEAQADYERGLALCAQTGDSRRQCASLSNYGSFLYETGRTAEAEKAFNEALAIATENGDVRAEAAVLGGLSNLLVDKGELKSAEELQIRALQIQRQIGNRRFEGVAMAGLANFYLFASRHDEAEAAYLEAIKIYRETGNRRFEGVALGNLAMVYEVTDRLLESERCAREALTIHRELENRRGIGVAVGNLARLAGARGDLEAAESGYLEALKLHRQVGNRHFEAYTLCEHARILLGKGRIDDARREWILGESLLIELGDATTLKDVRNAMNKDCAKAGVPPFSAAPGPFTG